MNIKFIPVISPNDNSTTIVETLTLQEAFDKYGHLMSHSEKMDIIKIVQESTPRRQEYLKRIEDEVDKQILEMLELFK